MHVSAAVISAWIRTWDLLECRGVSSGCYMWMKHKLLHVNTNVGRAKGSIEDVPRGTSFVFTCHVLRRGTRLADNRWQHLSFKIINDNLIFHILLKHNAGRALSNYGVASSSPLPSPLQGRLIKGKSAWIDFRLTLKFFNSRLILKKSFHKRTLTKGWKLRVNRKRKL
jgi:hypothetical protein